MKQQLIIPMITYVFFIWFIAILNFRTRLGAIRSRQISAKYFQAFLNETPPERVVVVGRHFDNQFQVPLLFLLGACAHLAIDQVNTLTLVLAWGFVASRLLHSWVHLGSNHLKKRVVAFAMGWFLVVMLWLQLGWEV